MNLPGMYFWLVKFHTRGHFIPGWGKSFGSNFIVSNAPQASGKPFVSKVSAHDLTMVDARYLSKEKSRCNTSVNVDIFACLDRYLESKIGCGSNCTVQGW